MLSLTVGKLREKQSRLLSAIEGLEAARQERNEEIATLKVRAAHLQATSSNRHTHPDTSPSLCLLPPLFLLLLSHPSPSPAEGE